MHHFIALLILPSESLEILRKSLHEPEIRGSWNASSNSSLALSQRGDVGPKAFPRAMGFLHPLVLELQSNGPKQPQETTKAAYNKTPVKLLGTQMCPERTENPLSYSTHPYPTVTVIPERGRATRSHTWGCDEAEQDAQTPQPGPGGCTSPTLCPSTKCCSLCSPLLLDFPSGQPRASNLKHKLWSFQDRNPWSHQPLGHSRKRQMRAPQLPLLDQGHSPLMSLNPASTLLFTLLSQAANITPTRLPKQDVCSGSRGNNHTTLLLKFRQHFIISS